MTMPNSHEIHFEILSSDKRTGKKKKDDSSWYSKSLRGRALPDSPFKTDFEISTMVFGEDDYPVGLEKGELVKMHIDKLEFEKRRIRLTGEVILQ